MKTHNYADGSKDTVELVVRKHEHYGAAHAGDHVIVAKSELNVPATLKACMTQAEADEIERRHAAKKAEKPKVSSVKAMVDEGMANFTPRETKHEQDGDEVARFAQPPLPPAPEPEPAHTHHDVVKQHDDRHDGRHDPKHRR